MIIQTPEDWWNLVEERWEELHAILYSLTSLEELGKAELAKTSKDWQSLGSCFQYAWFAAPDSPEIHQIPGWGVLCDLCSENWVFQDDSGPDPLQEDQVNLPFPAGESLGLMQFSQLVFDFLVAHPELEKEEEGLKLNNNLSYQAEGGGNYIRAGADAYLLHKKQLEGEIGPHGYDWPQKKCSACGCWARENQLGEKGKCPNCLDEATDK
jgi:hypothetical protein